ncbi:MAG: UDP-N-acetylmuramate dehydrogenase [Rhizobacter sp.]|nr:UDP-N-acetylmuramate dehydrogenase [Ferruginibacter sp.]
MNIEKNFSLKKYNTFGIDVSARYFSKFNTVTELEECLRFNQPSTFNLQSQTLILGGGSNILFTKDVDGLVLKNELKGIELIKEDADHVYLKAAAGENWHSFVEYCIQKNLAGVENLSLIPGNVGASPMQNIGAYGVEIKDVFHSLEAFHIADKKIVEFGLADCEFGYRESVFKEKYKNQFIITSVTYKLNKQPQFHVSYGAIQQELDTMGIKDLSIANIAAAVIRIRSSKLPDPAAIGNAGSFFKNPEIENERFFQLKNDFPSIVGHDLNNGKTKLAAGWLIEQCGWKGYRKGDAGCHAKQALVLVNYGQAKGNEIYDLSTDIIASVKEKFAVALQREVNIIL